MNNMIEGVGKYTHASGDTYVGEWKESQRHGKATYFYQYGGKFIGQFAMDERHGFGTSSLHFLFLKLIQLLRCV